VFKRRGKRQNVLVDHGAGLGCQLVEWARHCDWSELGEVDGDGEYNM
jgi:hypothetical protein